MWAQVLVHKYEKDPSVRPAFKTSSGHSRLWKVLCDIWPSIQPHVKWVVHNAQKTLFWEDDWCRFIGPLQALATSTIPASQRGKQVCEFTSTQGDWDWSEFQHLLPVSAVLRIAASPRPQGAVPDQPCWNHSNSGSFSLFTL